MSIEHIDDFGVEPVIGMSQNSAFEAVDSHVWDIATFNPEDETPTMVLEPLETYEDPDQVLDPFVELEKTRQEMLQLSEDSPLYQSLLEHPYVHRDDVMEQFKSNVDRAGAVYMGAISKSKVHREPKGRRMDRVDDLHQAYATFMVYSCVQPLRAGVSVESLARSAGMATTMWMLSPDFRNTVKDLNDQMVSKVVKSLSHIMANRGIKERAKLVAAEEKAISSGKPLSKAWVDRKAQMESPLWQKLHSPWVRDPQKQEDRKRVPYNASSAALTKISLDRSAYEQLRDPEVDVEALMSDHTKLTNQLYRDAEHDGIPVSELSRAVRQNVAAGMKVDATFGAMYAELADGALYPGESMRVRGVDGAIYNVITDEFVDTNGSKVTDGVFQVRAPEDLQEHMQKVSNTLYDSLMSTTSSSSMVQNLQGLKIGYALSDSDGTFKDHPIFSQKLTECAMLRAALVSDGYEDQCRDVMDEGLKDALDRFENNSPARVGALVKRLGPDWKKDVYTSITDRSSTVADTQMYLRSAHGIAAKEVKVAHKDLELG